MPRVPPTVGSRPVQDELERRVPTSVSVPIWMRDVLVNRPEGSSAAVRAAVEGFYGLKKPEINS